ncbi:unnamed protein product [Miscanthus lutarioriparius]|uniref:Uncharacterized protein n=1 Tax=Miscanthus lutarioriparius TaxID=422564 RepID=A0A811QFN2_9POAL|nr:unnamed protein product [Miscanthus lutarioriparius]
MTVKQVLNKMMNLMRRFHRLFHYTLTQMVQVPVTFYALLDHEWKEGMSEGRGRDKCRWREEELLSWTSYPYGTTSWSPITLCLIFLLLGTLIPWCSEFALHFLCERFTG